MSETQPVRTAREDLVIANHVLAQRGVVDGFGHVSIRHENHPDRFILARNRAPALVAIDDLLEYDLEVTLPFIEEQLRAAQKLMGDDFWSYGLEQNRHLLQRFLQRHHAESLSERLLTPEELFHPASLETHKI